MTKETKTEQQIIAIDLGYGDTKVQTEDKIFKFPSAVEKIREAMVSIDTEEVSDLYQYNGKKYRVGEVALTNAIATRGFNFLVEYGPLLVFHAIKKAGLDTKKPIKVITGLSIINMVNKEEQESFVNALRQFNINNVVLSPDITLLPQGRGVYQDFVHKNNREINGKVVVVDIGYNTFDFLVFEDGITRLDQCYATKKGANVIISELLSVIKRRFGADITEMTAKEIFNSGYFTNFGEKVDMRDAIENLKIDYAINDVLNEMRSKSQELLRSVDAVVFGGGGAYFLQAVKDKLPANVVFAASPMEFSNVRGYFLEGLK